MKFKINGNQIADGRLDCEIDQLKSGWWLSGAALPGLPVSEDARVWRDELALGSEYGALRYQLISHRVDSSPVA